MLEFYKRTAKDLWIKWMAEYNKVNAKIADTQLKKTENCCQK